MRATNMQFVLPRRFLPIALSIAAFALLSARSTRAHESIESAPAASASAAPADSAPIEVHVTGHHGTSAASSDEVRNRDLMLRPRTRPADLLEVVPGLFAVQHAGGGKANQYFVRGFDADHGTDIALFVDGVPVNLPSHGHGQGFADLHFLIPELVSRLESTKGPYTARYGDFATAAAVDLHLYDHLHESSVTFEAGRFGIFRGLFMVSPELGDDWSTIIAGEAYADDGPFTNSERLKRLNGFARVTRHMGPSTLSLALMSYTSGWNASGQVPLRAVGTKDLPTEFDAIDPTEGGSTQKQTAYVTYHYQHDEDDARALVYLTKYRFSLYSNFTFFLDDPVHGDQIEQDDERTVMGTSWSFTHGKEFGPIDTHTTFGLQARSDAIENGLHHTMQRDVLSTAIDAGVVETSVGLFAEEDVRITPWLRAIAGLRLDRFDVAVKDHLAGAGPSSSGIAGANIASPKMSWVISPFGEHAPRGLDLWDVYLNFGSGFHSNDARGATQRLDPTSPQVTLLTRATGWEVGTRVKVARALDFAAALFRLDLDSETIWNGDTGTTEAVGPTRRTGVELEARWKVLPWLFLDGDATFTHAVFRENAGNGNAVALAPTRTLAGGVSWKHPNGLFGAFRVRSIARRPANDGADFASHPLYAEGWTLFDAMAGYRFHWLEAAVDVRNVFNREWKEVQFATTSQLKGENAPVQDIHFTPGWPLTVVGRVTAYY